MKFSVNMNMNEGIIKIIIIILTAISIKKEETKMENLEKIFKMVALEKPKEVNVANEIKLFDDVFSNEEAMQIDRINSADSKNQIRSTSVIN